MLNLIQDCFCTGLSIERIIVIHISGGIFMPCSLNDFIFHAQSHKRILENLFNLLIRKSAWKSEKPSYFISLTSLFYKVQLHVFHFNQVGPGKV